jgi:hypothetical protein
LLASRKKFARQSVMIVRSVLKPRWAELFLNEVAFIDRMFGGFIDGKIMDSAIIGVLCYIGCSIFNFPNALLISAFVGITNVIPYFGPFIGALTACQQERRQQQAKNLLHFRWPPFVFVIIKIFSSTVNRRKRLTGHLQPLFTEGLQLAPADPRVGGGCCLVMDYAMKASVAWL